MTPSKTLFWLCIAFVVGIALQSVIKIPQIFIWGFLFLGVLIIFTPLFLFRVVPRFVPRSSAILGFCVFFLVLGIIRFQITEFNIENDKLKKLNDGPEKITLVGQIIDGPDIRNKIQRLKVKVRDSIILVTVGRYPEYNYLDQIKITGELKTPMITEDFNYKNYLLKDGIYSVMDFPKTELISRNKNYNAFTFLYDKILFAKEKLKDSINKNFSRPQNFIVEGIILGNDKNTPKDLKDKFNKIGLSHITAVSGSNIVILISLLMPLLLMLGLWRGQAFYFSLIFIWFYILLVGLPVSGVRAVIMGSVFLLAEKLGRQSNGSRIIVLAATLMLVQNPLLLFYDIGFQLSFLALMGIIYLKPIIDILLKLNNNHLEKLPARGTAGGKIKNLIYKNLNYLLDIVSVTIAAQISVLPIIVYNFGNISLVAPVTNLLILPIIPWLMMLGFASSIFGIFSNFLGWVFYLPSWLLLTYFLKVIDIFYQPWAVILVKNVSWIWLVAYYVILSALIWYFSKKLKPKFLGY